MTIVSGNYDRFDGKPCPFCGGNNVFVQNLGFFDRLVKEHGRAMMVIGCADCGCEYQNFSESNDYDVRRAEIISQWNHRKGAQ